MEPINRYKILNFKHMWFEIYVKDYTGDKIIVIESMCSE
jgi:hypothetical protein